MRDVSDDTRAYVNAARSAPKATVEAATRALHLSREPARAAAIGRGIDALSELARRLDRAALGEVAEATSDVGALIAMLTAPSAVTLVARDDPLADARLRWLRDRDWLLAAEGGTLSAKQVAEQLGISRQAIAKARADGRLVGLPLGPGRYAYPSWQFGPIGPLRGLRELRHTLDQGEASAWTLTAFVLAPNSRLDDDRPLDALRRGDIEAVLEVARAYGEQGAA